MLSLSLVWHVCVIFCGKANLGPLKLAGRVRRISSSLFDLSSRKHSLKSLSFFPFKDVLWIRFVSILAKMTTWQLLPGCGLELSGCWALTCLRLVSMWRQNLKRDFHSKSLFLFTYLQTLLLSTRFMFHRDGHLGFVSHWLQSLW